MTKAGNLFFRKFMHINTGIWQILNTFFYMVYIIFSHPRVIHLLTAIPNILIE